ncbi:putative prolyl oligopeptidase [Helianthus annuus]|uniref:Prolyl endopeptidase n=1 Tax=Helianthus annuus TaxID=4232 RepID=A0A251T1Y6_HELAN|nr:prolyl endopeptidase [Helianthus annuus]KAF5777702.1 putative prolyl oligopeptidase [Helianthus annuus]KAJ0489205.1 putative prolyl oligopeptidase [Helianthus annuus]KAJ0505081.1 putative prolyl oligopeptidase [Helianthus annuus]KAJ0674768.1 putative prolyl oligopeptidase [Helianthus annuus]KAJ0862474.1 putative prolyl oligopeptidase [Helianthus annuus]
MGSDCVACEPLRYPDTRRDDYVVDNYHGVPISDPYRWLEDPDSKEVKEFVEKQMKVTESVLSNCNYREKLHACMTKSFDYPRYGCPFQRGNKYFYFHNPGLCPHRVLYIQDSLNDEGEVLLDPNQLSEDGTVALRVCEVSHDAKYLAYGLSSSGSDWLTLQVMCVANKTIEPDKLSWLKFTSISWTHDTKGFFYCRFPAPKDSENMDAGTEVNVNHNHQLYYHLLGTKQSEDILCWENLENPTHILEARLSDDGKYLLMNICQGAIPLNKFYCCNLSTLPNGLEGHKRDDLLPFVKLIDDFEARYEAIANDDTIFTFLTNKQAPRYKVVRVDLKKPDHWIEVLQESKNDVIESVLPINRNQMIVTYLSDCKHVLQIRDFESGALLHKLPIDIGSIDYISARREDNMFFVKFSSFINPGVVYRYDLKPTGPDSKVLRDTVVPGFDQAEYHVNQVFVHSKDGTRVPAFIVAPKDIELDGSHPCLLYGYGGYGISLTPSFDMTRVVLARHLGVVFCVANIRGGGEYGEEWHQGGSLANKQNSFDDFVSVAEYLISKGYTNPSKLCIEGGSNGGILIGACINQRPDLFGCALAHAGVMDMLRYHKFTIGHAWVHEFGCSDREEDFRYLIKYSPLHNVRRPWEDSSTKATQYPSCMLLTADHDDRVVPLHTLKLLATMQHELCTSVKNSPQVNPIIGRISRKSGHGCGSSTQIMIDKSVDCYSFMAKALGASWKD